MPVLKKGTRIGSFVVIEALKRGGMAQIYHARMANSQREVALKVSLVDSNGNLQNANALRKEVDLLTSLNHPGIIRLLLIHLEGAKEPLYMARAHQLTGQPWYYAMEYLSGGSLAGLLKDSARLPLSVGAVIGLKIAETLSYIHTRRIVHLDVKPENILLRYPLVKGAQIEPVLIDFGVASSSRHQSGGGGTLITMAPEYVQQARGESDPQFRVDLEKVDIYALGVVVYRMWTGQYPFGGLSERSLTSAIINGTVQLPTQVNPDLPRQTDTLMRAWLSKDPVYRPGLDEIKRELKYLSAGLTTMTQDLAPEKKKNGFWPFGR